MPTLELTDQQVFAPHLSAAKLSSLLSSTNVENGIGQLATRADAQYDISIAKPSPRPAFVNAHRIMVDTGPEATWVAADVLRSARIAIRKKDQPFVMANGQQVTRNIGYAIIRCGDFETVSVQTAQRSRTTLRRACSAKESILHYPACPKLIPSSAPGRVSMMPRG